MGVQVASSWVHHINSDYTVTSLTHHKIQFTHTMPETDSLRPPIILDHEEPCMIFILLAGNNITAMAYSALHTM